VPLGHVRLLNAFQDNRGGWLAVALGLEERVPDTAKDQYGETGTDGQQRQHRGAGFPLGAPLLPFLRLYRAFWTLPLERSQ
jgi:hypothetical protein